MLAALPPPPDRRVVDEARVLAAGAGERIESLLAAHERATGEQVVVAIYPSLGGEDLEDWAHGVFESWRIGQKGKDNGVLLAIFSSDRKARIEVGYGVEDRLPDVTASRILRERLFPALKRGDWEGGVEDTVRGILAALGGKEAPPVSRRGPSIPRWLPIVMILLFLVLVRTLSHAQARSYGRRGRRSGVIVGPWWWGGGGFRGGGFGGGSFGGGGFSGGGGMSGGGGASGSW